ncbi:MAG: DUF3833 domain-containing protein [Verrucomicrobiota bacterium]|nr:DUF3833 domain-containing protein [Verrucomicrobiota bacterium]
MTLRSSKFFLLGALALFLNGCALFPMRAFVSPRPIFEPLQFFEGRTISSGVFESPIGKPREHFTTIATGRRHHDGDFTLAQSFIYEPGKKQKRLWHLRKIDAQHYEGTANDVVGVAKGRTRGNTFYLEYTVALDPGDPLLNVRLRQVMQLQRDGSVTNRATISKLGITVARVTERFEHAR